MPGKIRSGRSSQKVCFNKFLLTATSPMSNQVHSDCISQCFSVLSPTIHCIAHQPYEAGQILQTTDRSFADYKRCSCKNISFFLPSTKLSEAIQFSVTSQILSEVQLFSPSLSSRSNVTPISSSQESRRH